MMITFLYSSKHPNDLVDFLDAYFDQLGMDENNVRVLPYGLTFETANTEYRPTIKYSLEKDSKYYSITFEINDRDFKQALKQVKEELK